MMCVTFVFGQAGHRNHLSGLPPDLQAQSARRLRIASLLYAFVFFMSDPLVALLSPESRDIFFSSVRQWAPSTLSIGAALLVATLTWNRGIAVDTILTIGLLFEVAGSFGIAAAQYLNGDRFATGPPLAGLSWVAVWILSFTVIIPNPPRLALLAAILSASSVPLVVGLAAASGMIAANLSPLPFFFQFVLPYLLVVLIAYVGAQVVYDLGSQLTRARDLGSYRLVERLGQGGMGEVWEAQHRLLARPAAVKLLRTDNPGRLSPERRSELVARFEREAQATSSLRSPHTVQLYDFGVSDDGTFYYVMELLDGFDLEALVERFGPLPPERTIHLLKQVCDSLGEAHARGLIHRDIKPANIYVSRYGREVDFVKVLDFGLVKPQQDNHAAHVGITSDQTTQGTPAFMAPEQVLGAGPLDGRTDIYAVGCLGYWLLTGQLVFNGRTPMEMVLQHAQTAPVPPSQRGELDIPESLDELMLACLAKDPADRPPSADALAARLAAIETSVAWTADRARRWWDLHHLTQAVG